LRIAITMASPMNSTSARRSRGQDGFQDADGCPDPDNDADGILDKDDQCPNEPEDKDGFETPTAVPTR